MWQFFFILIELCKSCESKQYGTFGNSSLELDIADSFVWVINHESYRGHGWSTATTISKWTDGESFHVNIWYYKIFKIFVFFQLGHFASNGPFMLVQISSSVWHYRKNKKLKIWVTNQLKNQHFDMCANIFRKIIIAKICCTHIYNP